MKSEMPSDSNSAGFITEESWFYVEGEFMPLSWWAEFIHVDEYK